MTQKLLIVGGQGFIGTQLTRLALQKNYEVTVLDLFAKPLEPNSPLARAEILTVNATSLEDLRTMLQDRSFHSVINCAGTIDHTLYQNGGRRLIDQHFTVVLNLVSCLNRSQLQSFVQIGSSDEYGNLPAPQAEISREAPISPYSFGKAASTHFLQMLFRTEQFPARIVRLFLAYGPGQNEQRFLPQIIQGCLKNKTFPTSAGEQIRDFCYVEDLAKGIFRAMETPDAAGEIFNLASGVGISIRQVLETVMKLTQQGNPEFGKIPYRPGENMKLYASIEKAKQLLHWEPETSLEQGLRHTIAYYQQQLNFPSA